MPAAVRHAIACGTEKGDGKWRKRRKVGRRRRRSGNSSRHSTGEGDAVMPRSVEACLHGCHASVQPPQLVVATAAVSRRRSRLVLLAVDTVLQGKGAVPVDARRCRGRDCRPCSNLSALRCCAAAVDRRRQAEGGEAARHHHPLPLRQRCLYCIGAAATTAAAAAAACTTTTTAGETSAAAATVRRNYVLNTRPPDRTSTLHL